MSIDATLLTAVRTIALEVGIPAPTTVVNPNQQVAQIIAQINRAGEILRDTFPWPFMRQMFSTTYASDGSGGGSWPTGATTFVVGSTTYTCNRLIGECQWESSENWRIVGPVTDQEWAQWQYGVMTQPVGHVWRMADYQTVEFFPAMPAGVFTKFSVTYIVNEWVTTKRLAPSAEGQPDSIGLFHTTAMSLDADYHGYRPRLLIALAKRNFLESKGLPYEDAQGEYTGLLDAAKGASRSSRTISLSSRRGRHFVNYCNTPDTGYGS